MSFYEWLRQLQLDPNTPMGEFAEHIKRDIKVWIEPHNRSTWIAHMGRSWRGRTFQHDMEKAFEDAWKMYIESICK